jgi:hypothetical protein
VLSRRVNLMKSSRAISPDDDDDDDRDGHRNVGILRTPNAADSPRRLYHFRCVLFIPTRYRKGMVDFRAAIKRKTLPLCCFREHNYRGWKRAAVLLNKSNRYSHNKQASFIFPTMWCLARTRGPQVAHGSFSVMGKFPFRRTVYQIAMSLMQ